MLEEARRWRGTPHANRMAVPGVGVDCIHFLREVFVAAGVCDRFTLPYYDDRHGQGNGSNIMRVLMLECLHGEEVAADADPAEGDIVVFTVGRQSNHCGVILGGEIWHAVAKSRVRNDPLDGWRSRIQCFIRITAPGLRKRPETITKEEMKQ